MKALRCEFTIEASFIMPVILLCMMTVILYAYSCRDKVVTAFVVSEAALNEAHIEEELEDLIEDESDEYLFRNAAVQSRAVSELHNIKRLNSEDIKVRTIYIYGTAATEDKEVYITVDDTEKYLREAAAFSSPVGSE